MKILLATILLAAAMAAPASASGVPQTEGGVKCHHSFKKSYRLGKIVR
jgi:hypothetical protein